MARSVPSALYRGDFLSGFALPDSTSFEEWALIQREQLHQQALEALDTLAAYHDQQGDYAAPIGLARYPSPGVARSDGFPEDYRGDLFVALHGSWNRTPPAPCQVLRVHIVDGQPVAAEEFLTGFQDDPGQPCGQAWGRPAGVVAGADGALYVSDDQNGRIYRIVWRP
jgi:glucose/arabinose dehydrogenase